MASKKQSVKEANDQEIKNKNIIPQVNLVSISEKYKNLHSCGKTTSTNVNKKIVYKWKDRRNQA